MRCRVSNSVPKLGLTGRRDRPVSGASYIRSISGPLRGHLGMVPPAGFEFAIPESKCTLWPAPNEPRHDPLRTKPGPHLTEPTTGHPARRAAARPTKAACPRSPPRSRPTHRRRCPLAATHTPLARPTLHPPPHHRRPPDAQPGPDHRRTGDPVDRDLTGTATSARDREPNVAQFLRPCYSGLDNDGSIAPAQLPKSARPAACQRTTRLATPPIRQPVHVAADAHVNADGAHDSNHATRTRLETRYSETSDA